jgi:hypothetical protein
MTPNDHERGIGDTGDRSTERTGSQSEQLGGPDAGSTAVDRRRFLIGAATTAAAGLAGCPTTLSRTFSATPVVLPEEARDALEYDQQTVEEITVEEDGSESGVDYEATIESHLSVSDPAAADESDAPRPGLGALSTPTATIQGNQINPLVDESSQSVLAGDVLPTFRDRLLTELTRIDGSQVEWIDGPRSIEEGDHLDGMDDLSGELLGETVEGQTFGGIAQGDNGPYAVLVSLARRNADDLVFVGGALDVAIDEADADRPVVGPDDGYFLPEDFAASLSVYMEALPRWIFQQSSSTTTTTATSTSGQTASATAAPGMPSPTPTPSATPMGAPSSSGGRVIDDFEDGDRTEYRQLGIVNDSFVSSPVKHGSTALQLTNMYSGYGIESRSGLPNYPHMGDRFRAWFRLDGTAGGNSVTFRFGNDANGNHHTAAASKQQSGDWQVSIRGNGSPGNVGRFTASLSADTWYAFDISWGASTIELELVDGSGTSLGSGTASSTGDNGDDYVSFQAEPRSDKFYWDYAHVVGQVRQYPAIIDDFEDGNVNEYNQSGLMNPSVVNTPTKDGSQALQFTQTPANYALTSQSGLANYPHQGDRFRVWFRFDGASQGNLFRFEFGLDANRSRYYVEASKTGAGNNWQVTLANRQGGSSRSTITLSSGTWYAFDIAWGIGTMQTDVIDASETALTSTSITSTGDRGDDYIGYWVDTGQNNFYWDEVRIVGRA